MGRSVQSQVNRAAERAKNGAGKSAVHQVLASHTPPLAQDVSAPLYVLTDKVRVGIEVATMEISKDALSKISLHLLNPKQVSCPGTFGKVCPGSALSFKDTVQKHTHF